MASLISTLISKKIAPTIAGANSFCYDKIVIEHELLIKLLRKL